MAITSSKWIFIAILILYLAILNQGKKQVPCLFIFGDSLVDNGNNNELVALKANYPPNGIDYPGAVPTGRFSNGRNLADFLAEFLGFSDPIPSFATSKGSDVLRGVNYASGGGGILEGTGLQLGEVISFNQQLKNHLQTIDRIFCKLGNQTALDNHLNQCLYVINFGNEDYVNNYYFPLSPTRILYTPEGFADLMTQTLSQQLKTLHGLGSRKVVVYGLTTLGCIPQELARYPTLGSPCVDSINNGVELYNSKLFSLLNDLNTNLTDAHFTYINLTDLSSANPKATGTRVNNVACCKVGVLTGLCVPNGTVCSNRDEYYYWDNYHPTEFMYKIFASRAYKTMTN